MFDADDLRALHDQARAEYRWLRDQTCVPTLVGWGLACYAVYGYANAVAWLAAHWGGF